MAVGDRITSARTAGFMRRINALENLHSYTSAATATSVAASLGEFTGGPTQHIFYPVSGAGIKKNNRGLTSETSFVSDGTAQGEVDTTGEAVYVGYNESTDILYVTDGARIQAFDNTGSVIWENATLSASFFNGIAAMDDSTVFAWGFDSGTPKYYVFDSSGDETEPFTSSLGYGQLGNVRQYTATEFAFSPHVSHATKTVYIYESDGTLNETLVSSWNLGASPYTADQYGSTHSIVNKNDFIVGAAIGGGVQGSAISDGFAVYRKDGTWVKALDLSTTAYRGYVLSDNGDIYMTNAASSAKVRLYTEGSTQTTWYRYPTPGTDTGKVSLGTVDYGNTVPVDSALTGFRPHYFELRDMRAAIEAVATSYYSQIDSGTTDGSTTAFKLIQSGQNFDDTVTVGDIVINTTDSTTTTVTVVDSATQLTLNDDIMATGEDFIIKTNLVVSGSVNNNIFTIAIGTVTDWTTPTITHGDRPRETDYSDIESVLTVLEASSLA